MTREQQRKLRELKKSLTQMLKNKVKSYSFKKKDFMVWAATKELYFSLMIDVREKDGHCYCTSWEFIKPLWIDDLFWDIMDMSSNKSEPLSLRCIGIFTVHGMDCFEDKQELSKWSIEELETCVTRYMEHFQNTVNNSTIDSYYSIFDPTAYHGEIQEILILLHKQEYRKALDRIQSMEDDGTFQNNGIWFREYAENYCKKQMLA